MELKKNIWTDKIEMEPCDVTMEMEKVIEIIYFGHINQA